MRLISFLTALVLAAAPVVAQAQSLPSPTLTKMNGWATTFTASHLSDGAPTAGGSGYAVGNIITLSSGSTVTVMSVSGGAVTNFILNTPATVSSVPAQPETQTSTTGSGTGATVTLTYAIGQTPPSWAYSSPGGVNGLTILGGYHAGWGMLTPNLGPTCAGFISCGAGGNDDRGTGGGSGLSGAENTGFGYAALAQVTTGNWLTAFGHNAGGHEVDGVQSEYFGTDAGKYALHNVSSSFHGTNAGKSTQNATNAAIIGANAYGAAGVTMTVTGAANNGSGLVRLTVNSTTGVTTGDTVFVGGVGGTTEANTSGTPWYVTVVDSTHVDLAGTTFVHAYTSSSGLASTMPGGFVNATVTGAQTNAGAVQLLLSNTINLGGSGTAHVMGVGGTTEANGDWSYTVQDSNCVNGSCKVTLTGSTFTNTWTSGGHLTRTAGPSLFTVLGAQNLNSTSATGAMSSVVSIGSQVAGAAKSLLQTVVICPGCAGTNLGSTSQNNSIVLIANDAVSDVATATTTNAVGIGNNIKLASTSVQLGHRAGPSVTSSGGGISAVGYSTIPSVTSGGNLSVFGQQVGGTCTTAANVLLLGTNQNTVCTTNSESNVIHVGAGSSDILYVTGAGTPGTSKSMIAGGFQVGSTTALTIAGGEVGLAKITASGSAPGAAGGKIALVCGTNAGSAKLVVYAGTSTTAVTILDNIGAGVTGC